MINTFFVVGEIKKISISEPKDSKKAASAVLLVQHSVQRESRGGAVEFANAVMIRVPPDKFPLLRSKLAVGKPFRRPILLPTSVNRDNKTRQMLRRPYVRPGNLDGCRRVPFGRANCA